jgi:hypothetical protein
LLAHLLTSWLLLVVVGVVEQAITLTLAVAVVVIEHLLEHRAAVLLRNLNLTLLLVLHIRLRLVAAGLAIQPALAVRMALILFCPLLLLLVAVAHHHLLVRKAFLPMEFLVVLVAVETVVEQVALEPQTKVMLEAVLSQQVVVAAEALAGLVELVQPTQVAMVVRVFHLQLLVHQ